MVIPINAQVSLILGQRGDAYTLPEELLRMRAAVSALDRALLAAREQFPAGNELEIANAAAEGLVDAALSGGLGKALDAGEPVPLDMGPLIRYREQLGLAEDRHKVIDSATRSLVVSLQNAVRSGRDEIIAEHLAPAIAECMDQGRRAVKGIGDREPSRAGLYDAPKLERDAFAGLEAIGQRYVNVRRAYRNLLTFTSGTLERRRRQVLLGEFTLESLAVVWPDWDRVTHDPTTGGSAVLPAAPWPDDPTGRLAWIVRSGIEPWVPTPAELAEAVRELDERQTGERVQAGFRLSYEVGA
jgi:hypothetical protein